MLTETHDQTDSLRAQDLSHILHPYTDLSLRSEQKGTVLSRADGVRVWDSEGNEYLDALGGLWCVNVGYGRPEMAAAISNQVSRLPFYSMFDDLINEPAARLSEKLTSLAPDRLNHVLFTTGGSMSVDSAIRIVHHYFQRLGQPSRRHVISRDHAYHGSTYLAASLNGPEYHDGWTVERGFVHHISAPYSYRRPEWMDLETFCDVCVGELEAKIIDLGPENVACFIAEPIMGSGGVIVPPEGYNRRTREICRKYGVLYIADEVVTAFGRLGHMFASEGVYDTDPDIICCAKGISSGYVPLGATLLSDEIFEVISSPGGTFMHGFTYTGHPLSCTAGLCNLEILEREDICGLVRRNGPYFEEALHSLSDLPLVGDVRGSHFMMCIENVADKETRAMFPTDVDVGKRIWAHCQGRGVLVRPLRHLNVLSPSLIMTRGEIDRVVEVLRESILATTDDLTREGWLCKP